jgi:hypothetical protein
LPNFSEALDFSPVCAIPVTNLPFPHFTQFHSCSCLSPFCPIHVSVLPLRVVAVRSLPYPQFAHFRLRARMRSRFIVCPLCRSVRLFVSVSRTSFRLRRTEGPRSSPQR